MKKVLAKTFIHLAEQKAPDILCSKIYRVLETITPRDIDKAVETNTSLLDLALSDEETKHSLNVLIHSYPKQIITIAPRITVEQVLATLAKIAKERKDKQVLVNIAYILKNEAAMNWLKKQVDIIKNYLVNRAYAVLVKKQQR